MHFRRCIWWQVIIFSLIWLAPTQAEQPDSVSIVAAKSEHIAPTAEFAPGIVSQDQPISQRSFSNKIFLILFILCITFILNVTISLLPDWLNRQWLLSATTFVAKYPVFQTLLWITSFLLILIVVLAPPDEMWLIMVGTLGLGIGFALRDVLRNVLSGFIILVESSFRVGDKIRVGDYAGEVMRIGLHSTKLLTTTNFLISVPNTDIINQAIQRLNPSSGTRDIQIMISLSFRTDIDPIQARKIAYEAVLTSRHTCPHRPVDVYLENDDKYDRTLRFMIKASVFDACYEMAFRNDVFARVKSGLQKYDVG